MNIIKQQLKHRGVITGNVLSGLHKKESWFCAAGEAWACKSGKSDAGDSAPNVTASTTTETTKRRGIVSASLQWVMMGGRGVLSSQSFLLYKG